MKIIKAATETGGIVVEYEILKRVRIMAFPFETPEDEIKSTLQSIEDTELKRAATMEKNKERDEAKAKADQTCKKLNE